ncbi:MAG: sigma-70 family RNA polymerase sigma factor, partial [Bacteroides sp.]|nr:sigma-70 family RNA polymerase sigma factor [Bacteroides sp.]
WRSKHNDKLSLDSVQAESSIGSPERMLDLNEQKRLMQQIIESLHKLQRTILRMKDIEGYETDEIGEITGCAAEAIRSNLSRARKKVRDIYLQTIQERKERRKKP